MANRARLNWHVLCVETAQFPTEPRSPPTIYIVVSGRPRKSFRDWRENGEALTSDRLIALAQWFPSAVATLTLLLSFQIGWA